MADPTPYVPGLSHPLPPQYVEANINPRRKTITFASAAVPAFLGDEQMRFRQLRIEPVAGNSGVIEIQVRNETEDWETVDQVAPSDDAIDWPAPPVGGAWNGKSFRLKANNDGDKAKILYA